jgi:hypothetical protein
MQPVRQLRGGPRVLRLGVKQAATDGSRYTENTGAEEGKGRWLGCGS